MATQNGHLTDRFQKGHGCFLADNMFAIARVMATTDEILDYYRNSFADPGFSLNCQQQEVHIADSGEMAWSRGICKVTFTNSGGQKDSGQSRWLKVWVKGQDDSWRLH
jgi:ketosteroid isomerase-like protein